MSARPEPKVISEVCSLCGLDWKRHGKSPTTEKCIELLLGEVRSLNAQLATRPYAIPCVPVKPYPYPVRPYTPWWGTTWQDTYTYASSATSHTPLIVNASVRQIAP